MSSEEEVASFVRNCTSETDAGDSMEFEGAEIEDLKASENAGFEMTLVDGTRFQVVVTMIEEGQ